MLEKKNYFYINLNVFTYFLDNLKSKKLVFLTKKDYLIKLKHSINYFVYLFTQEA
jgi:hypothetical protein